MALLPEHVSGNLKVINVDVEDTTSIASADAQVDAVASPFLYMKVLPSLKNY
jgi:hypothetical protein